ncbi:MAG: DNA polymerase III subunit gamma/tau [Actinomycetota bacterium]|nr:DNA polymerase III subunit gamma/tau [Actinomycetota bacterium]
MAYLSLYRKYRSQTFEEILGQDHVSTTLTNAINEGRVSHAYLFTGPRGTGKTSTARILAKAMNCVEGPTPSPCGKCESCIAIADGSSLDVIEMDAASHSKVDETREILAGVPLATAGGRKKVYVIDEVHMLSTGSFNALLKTLEEPPPHVIFILATTEAHKVLQTIVSRTQRFDFRRIPADVLEPHLAKIATAESIDIEPEALALIARHAEGSARDALSVLDQLASFGGHISVLDVEALLGHRNEDVLVDLFDAIASADLGAVFRAMQTFVAQGADMRQLAFDALGHARSLLLLHTAPEAEELIDIAGEDRPPLVLQAEAFTTTSLLRTMDLIGKAIIEMRNAPNHRLLLEVALIRAAAPETDASPDALLGRIERLERRMNISSTPAATTEVDSAAEGRRPRRATEPAPRTRSGPDSTAEGDRSRKATEERSDEPPPKARAEPGGTGRPAAARSDVPAQIGLGHIRDAWPVTMQEVNKVSRRVGALLNPSRPVRFEGDALTIEVQSEYHRDTLGQEKNRAVLGDALHAALGIRPALAFAARGSDAVAAPAEADEPNIADVEGAEPVAVEEHDPVELVKKGLAAEVVEEVHRR